jgi:hypothetical protein
MSVNSVDSNSSQGVGNLLLQELLAEENTSTDSTGLSSTLDDLVSISSTGQSLSQAPDAVVNAMSDLFSAQKDVQGDLSQLKSYFKGDPNSLASLLSALKNGSSTYDALGNLSSSSDKNTLLSALLGSQNQGSLFNYLGEADSGSSSSSLSLFG